MKSTPSCQWPLEDAPFESLATEWAETEVYLTPHQATRRAARSVLGRHTARRVTRRAS